jgi:hypothetical protein
MRLKKLQNIYDDLRALVCRGVSMGGYREEVRVCVTSLSSGGEHEPPGAAGPPRGLPPSAALKGLLHLFNGQCAPLHFIGGPLLRLGFTQIPLEDVMRDIHGSFQRARKLYEEKVFSGRATLPAPVRCHQVLCGLVNALGLNYGPRYALLPQAASHSPRPPSFFLVAVLAG